jgi:hypothetical protein
MKEFEFYDTGGMFVTNWGILLLISSHLFMILIGISIGVWGASL